MNSLVAVNGFEKLLINDMTPQPALANALRRADDFIRLAVVSAQAAMATAPERVLAPDETGIFIGTAYGPLETNFSSLGSLIDDGEGQISPTLFSHSVFNAAAGYVARLLDIRGPALTLTSYAWPFITALDQARQAIAAQRVKRAVVLAVETYSALLEDAYKRFFTREEIPWQPGAVAWVLDPADAANGGAMLLEEISVGETFADSGLLLARSGESWNGFGLAGEGSHPLAYAYALTDFLIRSRTMERAGTKWELVAPFGRAELIFSRSPGGAADPGTCSGFRMGGRSERR